MSVLLVFLGGAAGGVLRHLLATWFPARTSGWLSPGLWTVNLAGSFALGLLTRLVGEAGHLLWGVGLCGGLTTFSTLAVEVLGIWRAGHRRAAVAQGLLMVTGGVLAAAAGLSTGGVLGAGG